VFSLILGYFILNEPIDILKVLGILVIISGVCLIAMGGNKNATPKEKVNEQKENANE
jgi:drug/metabolite transporter (DMT)-like permease